MHYTVIDNMLTLLRAGAFDDVADAEIVPMSQYKWRVLMRAATVLGVLQYVVRGGEKLIPGNVYVCIDTAGLQCPSFDVDGTSYLFNRWTQQRLDDVREEEMNSHTTSDESLHVLDLIVANANCMVRGKLSVLGIVSLGTYMRENTKAIDYEKVVQWLRRTNLMQVSSLLGSILIDVFGFSEDEVPFLFQYYSSGEKKLVKCITETSKGDCLSLPFRLNMALIETLSYYFKRATSVITNIEE